MPNKKGYSNYLGCRLKFYKDRGIGKRILCHSGNGNQDELDTIRSPLYLGKALAWINRKVESQPPVNIFDMITPDMFEDMDRMYRERYGED
jgi:hypothetical protein